MNENDLDKLRMVVEERKKMKDDVTTCEWCGITYPKGGFTYYKIKVHNMSVERLVENLEKGIEDKIDEHIICSDCHEHLKECKEC